MECQPDESDLKAFYMEIGSILMEYDDTKTETETKSKRICGKRFSICLSGLFAVLTGFDDEEEYVPTKYGYIQKETAGENEWYDFKTEEDVSCMSEEICEVLDTTPDYVLLQELNTKVPFKLSHNEFNIAAVRSTQ